MQVTITGLVGDSDASLSSGRIEFSQAQRFYDGVLQVTGSPSTAQVIRGELRTLDGNPFQLPSNPDNTAVRVREILGGETFEWWTAVPEADSVEYRELPVIQSDEVPSSVWGPPPWVTDLQQAAQDTQDSIQGGMDVANALGGLSGIQNLVDDAQSAAADSATSADASLQSAASASSEADRAEAAASSIDMSAINSRLDGMDTSLGDKVDKVSTANRLYGTSSSGDQTSIPVSQGATSGAVPIRASGGRLPGVGSPTSDSDAATKKYVDDSAYESPENPYLRQASLYSYGHSFTALPNNYCRPNYAEHQLRLQKDLGMADVFGFGRGGTYLPDTLALALNGVRATDKSRTWPGLATIASSDNAHGVTNSPDHRDMPRGVVLIQNYLNETAYEWAFTPSYLGFWERSLRSLIAVVSSKGQKSSAGAVGTAGSGSAAWSDMAGTTLYSNLFPDNLLFKSSKAGDYREFRVSGDDIWILTAGARPSSSSRQLDVYVNGNLIQSLTPAGMMDQDYVPVIAESESANLWPVALKVSGLNAAAGTSGFKTVRVQVAPTAGWAYISGALFPRVNPPEVFVAYEPQRMGVADWETKNAIYKAIVDQVVSEFPNAHVADLGVGYDIPTMNITDNIHPNDRGQAHMASRYLEAINNTITDWTGGIAVL